MSDEMEIEFTEGIPDDPRLQMIDSQLILISSICDCDLSGLYDLWNEEKITAISNAMRIIIAQQEEIMPELKPKSKKKKQNEKDQ